MKYLGFNQAQVDARGKRIAECCFDERSNLPVGAACVVASGVRETLSAHFGYGVNLRLFEPTVPSPDGWREIERDAILYRIAGRVADAAIIIRPSDAAALAGAVFGESARGAGALSQIERTVVERVICTIAGTLSAVCGTGGEASTPTMLRDLSGFVTYFELALDAPAECRIGIALSRDPRIEPQPALSADDLLDLPLEVTAGIDLPAITARTLLELELGEIVPMTSTGDSLMGTLSLGGRRIAHGECGVSAHHYALALGA